MAIQEKYNITGQKFGEWTVLEDIGGGKVTCQCSCGTIKTLYKKAVKEGKTKSCGCLKSKVPLIRDDLTGKVFGQWTVLKEVGNGKVVCRCSCGTEKEVYKQALKEGKSTSCGCSYIGKIKRESSIGKVYGELTVIDEKPNGIVTCKCSCGNIKDYYLSNLEKGTTKSCGHKRVDNVVGQRFGYWTVLKELGYGKVLCKCACGTEKEIYKKTLKEGRSKSCGCKSLENLQKQLEEKYLGKTFGYWTVIGVTTDHNLTCRCICGTEKVLTRQTVTEGKSKSCGCKQKESALQSTINKYGDLSNSRSKNPRKMWQAQVVSSKESFEKYLNELNRKTTINELSTLLDITEYHTSRKIKEYGLEGYVNYRPHASKYEKIISEFISKLSDEITVKINDRSAIYPNELDIYIPEIDLAIEINGDYWHSDVYVDPDYHVAKTKACKVNNINLIHIHEYELKNPTKCNIIFNIIKNSIVGKVILDATPTVKFIDEDTAEKFLENNHLHGFMKSDKHIGVYVGDKLIEVASISKIENTHYSIDRYCSLLDRKCLNGLANIIDFLNTYNINKLTTYVDIEKFRYSSYIKNKFKIVAISNPEHVWIKNNKLYKDEDINKYLNNNGITTTIDDYMRNLGYMKIYDCGKYKLVYEREEKSNGDR